MSELQKVKKLTANPTKHSVWRKKHRSQTQKGIGFIVQNSKIFLECEHVSKLKAEPLGEYLIDIPGCHHKSAGVSWRRARLPGVHHAVLPSRPTFRQLEAPYAFGVRVGASRAETSSAGSLGRAASVESRALPL